MLIPAWRLVDRLQHPRSRAQELDGLRRRFAAGPGPAAADADEVEDARRLRRLRIEVSGLLEGVTACSRCARRHPLPHGRWDGGQCCGGPTWNVFGDDEIAALRLAGTAPRHLRAPRADHAGCAFRGPTGCSLAAADRPTICVRYLCRDLSRDLAEQGRLQHVLALVDEMEAIFDRFVARRSARREAAEWERLLADAG